MFATLYERLQFKYEFDDDEFEQLIETRSGVVAVGEDGTVYGGGMYDGGFNIGLKNDVNRIYRAYALSAIHPDPKRVLMIGLGSGSWGRVIADHAQVESLKVIEINPGYLTMLRRSPGAQFLDHRKVEIVIDDGRRWLRHHPEERFDAIVMNTTFHWRAHATNLLSVEFLELARAHLREGGVLYYNTTWSGAVLKTAATVYPHAMRVGSFVAVSDSPMRIDRTHWGNVLRTYVVEGRPVLDLGTEAGKAALRDTLGMADTLALDPPPDEHGMEGRASLLRRHAGERVITDDNMGTEWTR